MLYKAICICSLFLAIGVVPVFSQTLSDNDIKKEETPVNGSLKNILSLQPVMYEYNTSTFPHLKLAKGTQYGFNTEEFQEVFPSLVSSKRHSYMQGKNRFRSATVKSIDMDGLIPVLVAALQEQQAQIDQLRKEISGLKDERTTSALPSEKIP